MLITLATPMPTRRPSAVTQSIATGSPACAAATASRPGDVAVLGEHAPQGGIGMRGGGVAREAVEDVTGGERLERSGLREARGARDPLVDRDKCMADLAGGSGGAAERPPVDDDPAPYAGAEREHHEAPHGRLRAVVVGLCERGAGRVVVHEHRYAETLAQHRAKRHVGERDVRARAHPTGRELDDRRDADAHRFGCLAAGDLPDSPHELSDQRLRARGVGGVQLRRAERSLAHRGDGHLGASDVDADHQTLAGHERKLSAACCAAVTVSNGAPRGRVRGRRRDCVYAHHVTGATTDPRPDRNLALELVRVTEAAALGAARLIGRGDKEAADAAAVDAMRHMLGSVDMDGVVVIGEGEKDNAPMLFNGESIGNGSEPSVDIAVDPLEGTTLTARGMPSALSVIALSPRGTMFDPGPCVYMEKIAGGAEIADLLDLDRPLGETLALIAERKRIAVEDVMVVMLDRPRHAEALAAIHAAGARARLISDGDVSAALLACGEGGPVDLLWGIGGTPEGVIAAAAIKCVGGQLLGRLWPRDDDERRAAADLGYDLDAVLGVDDLVAGDDCFFSATGVTDGDVLQGVRYQGARSATTESLVMRSRSGTVRRIHARHDRSKLRGLDARYG